MGGVMTQVDAAEFPHELVHIEVPPEMSQRDGALNKFGQGEAPLTFHLEDLCFSRGPRRRRTQTSRPPPDSLPAAPRAVPNPNELPTSA